MSASLVLQDSRLRSLIVLAPAWCLLVFMATQLAAEEYLATVGLMGLFLTMVMFTTFVKTVRLEAAIMGMLLIGYLIGNRGFAQLALVKPVFVGEMGLGVIVMAMTLRFLLSRETPTLDSWLPRMILIFLSMATAHFLFNFRTYGLDAVRDFAIVYYTIFFFAAERLAQQESTQRFLERCLMFGFAGLAVVALMLRVNPEMLASLEINGTPVFFQKDDLTSTFSAVAVFFFFLRPAPFGNKWLRWGLVVMFMVFVINGITRSALAGMIVASLLCFVANKRSFFLYPVIALIAGLTVLAGFSVAVYEQRTSEFDAMQEKIISMVDFSGDVSYKSELGQLKAGNNEFRRVFWQSVIDETNMQNPMLGLGFGYDFYPRFQQLYGRGDWDGLRSPHNYFITIYGRMGVVGVLVLLTLCGTIIYQALRAAKYVGNGLMDPKNLFYWCAAFVILVSSALGVVLEGPMGAIIFWSLLGVAFSSFRRTRLQLAVSPEATAGLPSALPILRPSAVNQPDEANA